jgi:NADH-quinone oxidoreductase subunit M
LLGAFGAVPRWTAAAATGVILGAVYMLWMYRRVILGPLKNPANEKLPDLNARELLLLAPILILIVLMGVYPQPFLRRIEPAVSLTLKKFPAMATRQASIERPAADSKNDGR